MNLFSSASRASARLSDEAVHEMVFREIKEGVRRDGLWAKALSQANMHEGAAMPVYIRLRAQSIRDEMTVSRAVQEQGRAQGQAMARAHEGELEARAAPQEPLGKHRPLRKYLPRSWVTFMVTWGLSTFAMASGRIELGEAVLLSAMVAAFVTAIVAAIRDLTF